MIANVCERVIEIPHADPAIVPLLRGVFGGLLRLPQKMSARTACDPERASPARTRASRRRVHSMPPPGTARALFEMDKQIGLALQRARPDLFFVHAAAVALQERAAILVAPSGTGKSTLTLALMQAGFDYLSDELAPIELARMKVHPYPRAICLKAAPPRPYRLPAGTLDTGGRLYVPVETLPGRFHTTAQPLAACIFLERRLQNHGPELQEIPAASAAARLVSNALNAGAHPHDGIDAAVRLARALPCLVLNVTNLHGACLALRTALSPFSHEQSRAGEVALSSSSVDPVIR
jgi:hypothetical protein